MKKFLIGFVSALILFIGYAVADDIYGTEYIKKIVTQLIMLTTAKVEFYQDGSGEKIYSSATDQLDVDATTEVEVTTSNLEIATTTVTSGTGFWAGAPSLAANDASNYFFYFNDFIGQVPFAAAAGSAGGWKSAGDATYDVTAAAGTLGGWCLTTAETGSNNEVYHQLGEKGTETFVECTASSGNKWWFEVNFTPVSVTNAANFFIGVAEEGAAAANFIADAGDDIADVDVIGFMVFEGDPNAMESIYQTSGSAFASIDTIAITAANTTVGLYFDGASTMYYYVGGTSVGSIAISTTGFPDTEELAPIIAVKQGAADGGVNMDWIKLVSER